MADSTVVFVTGVGKGIGKGLLEAYLLRPNYTVIGSIRDKRAPIADELRQLPKAEGTKLIIVSIEATSATDVPKAIEDLAAAGIDHVDIAIPNSGFTPAPGPLAAVDVDEVTKAISINAVGPIYLYKGLIPLLEKSKKSPKWAAMSTGAASVTRVEPHRAHNVLAYGMSKASQNFFTQAIHSAHPWIISFAIHPGLVQTEMGNVGARMMGLEQAPDTIEDSVNKVISVIDGATREKTSGKLLNTIDGTEFPW
ncbi:NAD(P)-binding protein [Nemania diffusa]|nr:NAD(P)-binding protein [Nemania diffusa]